MGLRQGSIALPQHPVSASDVSGPRSGPVNSGQMNIGQMNRMSSLSGKWGHSQHQRQPSFGADASRPIYGIIVRVKQCKGQGFARKSAVAPLEKEWVHYAPDLS